MITTHTTIYDADPILKQLKVYKKSSFIHLYIEFKKYIIKIFKNSLPKEILVVIFSFISIDTYRYLPDYELKHTTFLYNNFYSPQKKCVYDMTMWNYCHQVKLILDIDIDQIRGQLYVETCCQDKLDNLIQHLNHFNKFRDSINKKIGHLIYKKNPCVPITSCKCVSSAKKTKILDWNTYNISQKVENSPTLSGMLSYQVKRIATSNLHTIYYDIINLYLYINYSLDL